MKNLVLWLLTGTALVSMWISATELNVTEIGFEPGSPDPNIHQTEIRFGTPLPWVTGKRSINEAAGYDILLLFRRQLFPHLLNLSDLIGSEIPSSHHLLTWLRNMPNFHTVRDPSPGTPKLRFNIQVRVQIDGFDESFLRQIPQ
jgi:hypothetical protein